MRKRNSHGRAIWVGGSAECGGGRVPKRPSSGAGSSQNGLSVAPSRQGPSCQVLKVEGEGGLLLEVCHLMPKGENWGSF